MPKEFNLDNDFKLVCDECGNDIGVDVNQGYVQIMVIDSTITKIDVSCSFECDERLKKSCIVGRDYETIPLSDFLNPLCYFDSILGFFNRLYEGEKFNDRKQLLKYMKILKFGKNRVFVEPSEQDKDYFEKICIG